MCTSVSKLTERGSSTRNTKQAQLRHLAVTASDFSKYTCPMRKTRTCTQVISRSLTAGQKRCGVGVRDVGLERGVWG